MYAPMVQHARNMMHMARHFGDAPGLKDCLRISMGRREENDIWYSYFKAFTEGRA